jgi:hypothetical protein
MDGSGWFHGEFQIGWGEIVTAFHVETKPLALNAFSKSRFVLAILLGKVNITIYPKCSRSAFTIASSVAVLRGFILAQYLKTKN